MSQRRLTLFEETLQTSSAWIREIEETLGITEDQQAYHLLCATLQTLRDRLRPDDALQLAAQLPVLIRGLFYEGWRLSEVPMRIRSKDELLAEVASRYRARPLDDLEEGVRAVIAVMSRNLDFGETYSLIRMMPEELRGLWPPRMVAAAQSDA